MRRIALIAMLAACHDQPAPRRATLAPTPAPTEIELRLYTELLVPDTGVVVTLLELTPEQPREELEQTGALLERVPPSIVVRLRRGAQEETVRWEAGAHEAVGLRWEVAIGRETVRLRRAR